MSEPTINPNGNNPGTIPDVTAAFATQALLMDVLGDRHASQRFVDHIIEAQGMQGLVDCILLWVDTFLAFGGYLCDDPDHDRDLSSLRMSAQSVDGSSVDDAPPAVKWALDFLLARAQQDHAECRRLLDGLPEQGDDVYQWVLHLLATCSLNLRMTASQRTLQRMTAGMGN